VSGVETGTLRDQRHERVNDKNQVRALVDGRTQVGRPGDDAVGISPILDLNRRKEGVHGCGCPNGLGDRNVVVARFTEQHVLPPVLIAGSDVELAAKLAKVVGTPGARKEIPHRFFELRVVENGTQEDRIGPEQRSHAELVLAPDHAGEVSHQLTLNQHQPARNLGDVEMAPAESELVLPGGVQIADGPDQIVDMNAVCEARRDHGSTGDTEIHVEIGDIQVERIVKALDHTELVVDAGDPPAGRDHRLLAGTRFEEHPITEAPELVDKPAPGGFFLLFGDRGRHRKITQRSTDSSPAQPEDQIIDPRFVTVADQDQHSPVGIAPFAVLLTGECSEESEKRLLLGYRVAANPDQMPTIDHDEVVVPTLEQAACLDHGGRQLHLQGQAAAFPDA